MNVDTGIFERLLASTSHPSKVKPYNWQKESDNRLSAQIGDEHITLDRRAGHITAEVTKGIGEALAKESPRVIAIDNDKLGQLFHAASNAIAGELGQCPPSENSLG